jgi:hypothetical protein
MKRHAVSVSRVVGHTSMRRCSHVKMGERLGKSRSRSRRTESGCDMKLVTTFHTLCRTSKPSS